VYELLGYKFLKVVNSVKYLRVCMLLLYLVTEFFDGHFEEYTLTFLHFNCTYAESSANK